MSVCRRCGEPGKLIKAHAIPEAFFRVIRAGDAEPLLLVSSGQYTRRAPIGVYDPAILCDRCEPLFGDLDGYAARTLLNELDSVFTPLRNGEQIIGYESAAANPQSLLRFFASVLWRASVSSQPFYHRISLGVYEPAALRLALHGEDDSAVFDAVLSRWPKASELGIASHGVMDPFRHKYDGVNAYRLYLGEVVADIKVDAQPFPRQLAALSLRNAPPVRAPLRDFRRSSDFAAMAKTARSARRPRRRAA